MRRILLALTLVALGVSGVAAQWLNLPTPGVPRTRDGKPRLDAPTPRIDGHPDLSGVWMHDRTPEDELKRLFGPMFEESSKVDVPGMESAGVHKHAIDILADLRDDKSPMSPQTAELVRKLPKTEVGNCNPAVTVVPFPLAGLLSEPIKIVQAPRLTMVLYEVGNSHRQIFTDGRQLPRDINLPSYLGYSVGRWDGETFVVQTTGFNSKMPLDAMGHPHSEQLRVTERFRRRDFGHLDVEMTFDDPAMYTRPFTIQIPHTLLVDQDIFEMYPENEKDCERIAKTKN